MSRFCPDVVIHLAAAVITNPKPSDVKMLIRSNLEFGSELLEAMSQSGVKAMVNTGTFWQNYNSSDYNPVDFYAATKEAFEKIIQYYVDAHDFRVITLRLFDVYGEDDPRPKIWNQLKRCAQTGESIDLSPGEQLIDLVHVDDVAMAYKVAADLICNNTVPKHEIYGVCSGCRMKLKEMVESYISKFDSPVNVVWGVRPYRKREMMTLPVYDVLKGWRTAVSQEIGFNKFLKKKH